MARIESSFPQDMATDATSMVRRRDPQMLASKLALQDDADRFARRGAQVGPWTPSLRAAVERDGNASFEGSVGGSAEQPAPHDLALVSHGRKVRQVHGATAQWAVLTKAWMPKSSCTVTRSDAPSFRVLDSRYSTATGRPSRTAIERRRLMHCVKWLLPLPILLITRLASADEWWGHDKALHFSLSIAISSAGYATAVPFTETRGYRAMTGAVFGITAGAAKEVYDATGRGDPSWRDFTWDIAGTAVGVLAAYAVDLALTGGEARGASTGIARSAIALRF